jgi:hypothetical protein
MLLDEICQMEGPAKSGNTSAHKKYVYRHDLSLLFHGSLLLYLLRYINLCPIG